MRVVDAPSASTQFMFLITRLSLEKAWREIYRSKPKAIRRYSRGIDNITIEDFSEKSDLFLDEIYRQLKGDFFEFKPLKEYKIPRPGKKSRLIQAPTVADRIVQKVMNDFLMNTFQGIFIRNGIVGSVKGTTIKKIINTSLAYHRQGYIYLLKTDIIDFFPTINKKRLKKILFRKVHDKYLRILFDKYLRQSRRPGIPQGTPLSPFMANLYLMNLDLILNRESGIKHFRYIDDLVVFCESESSARRVYEKVRRLFNQLDLSIHPLGTPGKTQIDLFDKGTIDILGVIYKNGKLLIKPRKYKAFIDETITPIQFKSILNPKLDIPVAIKELINDLNYEIGGWASVYSFCDIRRTYIELDKKLQINFQRLLGRVGIDKKDQDQYIKRLLRFTSFLR